MGQILSDSESGQNLLRLFVAIDMPREVVREIVRVQAELQRAKLFSARYVDSRQAHLTLQFIGYVEPSLLGPIKKILDSVTFTPFEFTLGELGFFGEDAIKVVWLKAIGEKIPLLAQRIEEGLSLGAKEKGRPFHPHVTVARVRSSRSMGRAQRVLANIKVKPISFTVKEFVLKQSTLTPEGPIYINLQKYKAS